MADLAIETLGLTKIFKKKTLALDSVDLQIRKGEIVALLGPNGAGKTTLLKTLATLILPDQGKAKIFGFDVVRQPEQAKSFLSLVVGEERSFYWRLTGRQNLEFFATLYNLSRQQAHRKIKEAADQFGLRDLDKPYQEYSTGNKNRLALARSFLHDAQLILMDEPTRSLDPRAALQLRELIKSKLKQQGRTLLFSTHHTEEAEVLADRIVILDQGKVKACGTFQELQAQMMKASLAEIFQACTAAS